MRYIYPVALTQDEAGYFLVTFPDVAEAATDGVTIAQALREAEDALIAALRAYIGLSRPIPSPSPARGRSSVALPALVATKLALYEAMRARRVSKAELGRTLGKSESLVRRLLDLDHQSHISQLEDALVTLDQRLVVSVRAA